MSMLSLLLFITLISPDHAPLVVYLFFSLDIIHEITFL